MASPLCGGRWQGLSLVLLLALLASASAVVVTVNGVQYDVTLSPPSTMGQLIDSLKSTPWFGNQALAEALALELKFSLGTVNKNGGPVFLFSEDEILVWVETTARASALAKLVVTKPDPTLQFVFALGEELSSEGWRSYDPVTSSVVWVPQVGCLLDASHMLLDRLNILHGLHTCCLNAVCSAGMERSGRFKQTKTN